MSDTETNIETNNEIWYTPVEPRGYYHKYNTLKFRIAYALFMLRKPTDTKTIGEYLNIHPKRISSAFSHYKKTGSPYFKRIKKFQGATNHDVKWQLTRSGMNFLANCIYNINHNLDLNFAKNKQQIQVKNVRDTRAFRLLPFETITFSQEEYRKFFGISRQGYENGLAIEDVFEKIPTVTIEDKIICK